MKCPYCQDRPNMVKKHENHDYWWECPVCRKTVGKKETKEEADEQNGSDS